MIGDNGINVGYAFPNTANDVTLSYLNFDTTDTANAVANSAQNLQIFNPSGGSV